MVRSGPSAGKSLSSCRAGHYSHGVYSWAYGGWTSQVSGRCWRRASLFSPITEAGLYSCIPASAKRENMTMPLWGLTWSSSGQSRHQIRKRWARGRAAMNFTWSWSDGHQQKLWGASSEQPSLFLHAMDPKIQGRVSVSARGANLSPLLSL